MNINSKGILSAFLASLLWTCLSWAHGGNHHDGAHHEQEAVAQNDRIIFERINSDYVKTVRPVFETKCFACHAQGMTLPWYSKVPLIKGMIEYDVAEAKKHLDMTNDFPFKGHGGPEEDLEVIQETLKKADMPPLRYRMIHRSSALNAQELKTVQDWIDKASQEFKFKNSNEHKGDHQ